MHPTADGHQMAGFASRTSLWPPTERHDSCQQVEGIRCTPLCPLLQVAPTRTPPRRRWAHCPAELARQGLGARRDQGLDLRYR